MIIVTGSVTARPEALPELAQLALEHVRRSRLEPGCLLHSANQDLENQNRVVFLECWLDRDALKVHFGVPESRAFAKALTSLASEPTTLEIYEAERVELQHL
jgi:quinol monooxygenase YgiN